MNLEANRNGSCKMVARRNFVTGLIIHFHDGGLVEGSEITWFKAIQLHFLGLRSV